LWAIDPDEVAKIKKYLQIACEAFMAFLNP
jgi:hypothetical protein